ncbi:hypothetical protein IE53DRAFT_385382 [Violaceomyces palustris]|uniref:Uncharacterized protein n=1 Tax=Violaceomyces palustris TaxID=1673888 RepID=A0ACD0P2A5_9BASI|nr:hypothetical protein IE53DRAFT_385382 [Violaceomyces palustris]
MSSLSRSPLPTLRALDSSLSQLDRILQPLLANQSFKTLNEDLQSGSSVQKKERKGNKDGDKEEGGKEEEEETNELAGRLDSARMQVSLAYVLLDLIWIYLKTKGIDPTNHPVMSELERVKSYFTKIKSVQDAEGKEQEKHTRLDKSAAGRFIRAALASGNGTHTRFEGESKDGEEEEEEDVEEKEGKSGEKKESEEDGAAKVGKKGRVIQDPFEGYDKPSTPSKSLKRKESTATLDDRRPTSKSPKVAGDKEAGSSKKSAKSKKGKKSKKD